MSTREVRVWDPLVRIFHWSLVLAFAAAYLTGDEWDKWEDVHELAGYAALGLILFRIVWGFIGSKYARFSDFLYSPAAVVEYLRSLLSGKPKHYLGHNPAGGWMIILLLAGVFATGFTGLKLLAEKEGEGPLAANLQVPALITSAHAESDAEEARERAERAARTGADIMGMPSTTMQPAAGVAPLDQATQGLQAAPGTAVQPTTSPLAQPAVRGGEEEGEGEEGEGGEGDGYWKEWHEFAANFTLLMVILHVLGVIVSSRLHGENLARAMVTGVKQDQDVG